MENLDASVLFLKLRNMGIEKVRVDFSGGGDSGDIDNVTALDKNDNDVTMPEEYVHQIHELVWPLLNDGEDWWNNDGGNGDFTIHLESGTYDRTINVRITDYEVYVASGSITEALN